LKFGAYIREVMAEMVHLLHDNYRLGGGFLLDVGDSGLDSVVVVVTCHDRSFRRKAVALVS
jgi:hypothetical protein